MALSATMIWEVRTTGNAANAGGFNAAGSSPGTDYSQQDSPQVTIDGATITATVHTSTDQLTIAGYTVAATDNRNTVQIAGGTMTAGTYEIIAVDVGNNRWTLDRSGGTAAQTGTGRMGGANSDPALIAAIAVSSNVIYVKAGTYSITSTSANVAGGRVSLSGQAYVHLQGYQTSRGDLGTAPLLQASGISSTTLLNVQNSCTVANVSVDGAALTSMRGVEAGSTQLYKVTALNCTNVGINADGCTIVNCRATGCSSQPAISSPGSLRAIGCVAHDNTITGFASPGNQALFLFCISYSNSGASSDGFQLVGPARAVNCTAYGNGRDGFRPTGGDLVNLTNCIAEANVGVGFKDDTVNAKTNYLLYCAVYDNGTNVTANGYWLQVGLVTGSGSFFTDAASGDFSLNDTAGAGAELRGLGYPGVFPDGLSEGFLDVGAVQSGQSGVEEGSTGAGPLVGGRLVN